MIKLIALVMIVIVVGVSVYSYAQGRYVEPTYCKLSRDLTKQHIQEMIAEGFVLTMTGGGMNQRVNSISVGFELNKKMTTVEEARLLYVRSVERLLARINHDSVIRPYLKNYPFTVNNLEYQIGFLWLPVDTSGISPIVYVSVIKGNVLYRINNPTRVNANPLELVYEEPYSEALRIVREAGQLPNDLGGS